MGADQPTTGIYKVDHSSCNSEGNSRSWVADSRTRSNSSGVQRKQQGRVDVDMNMDMVAGNRAVQTHCR
jgi:hypothetical protein